MRMEKEKLWRWERKMTLCVCVIHLFTRKSGMEKCMYIHNKLRTLLGNKLLYIFIQKRGRGHHKVTSISNFKVIFWSFFLAIITHAETLRWPMIEVARCEEEQKGPFWCFLSLRTKWIRKSDGNRYHLHSMKAPTINFFLFLFFEHEKLGRLLEKRKAWRRFFFVYLTPIFHNYLHVYSSLLFMTSISFAWRHTINFCCPSQQCFNLITELLSPYDDEMTRNGRFRGNGNIF